MRPFPHLFTIEMRNIRIIMRKINTAATPRGCARQFTMRSWKNTLRSPPSQNSNKIDQWFLLGLNQKFHSSLVLYAQKKYTTMWKTCLFFSRTMLKYIPPFHVDTSYWMNVYEALLDSRQTHWYPWCRVCYSRLDDLYDVGVFGTAQNVHSRSLNQWSWTRDGVTFRLRLRVVVLCGCFVRTRERWISYRLRSPEACSHFQFTLRVSFYVTILCGLERYKYCTDYVDQRQWHIFSSGCARSFYVTVLWGRERGVYHTNYVDQKHAHIFNSCCVCRFMWLFCVG